MARFSLAVKSRKIHCLVFSVLAAAMVFCSRAEAKIPPLPLRCSAPQWLQNSIRGSMEAVWRELQNSRLSRQTAVEALALVGSRLFPGYRVSISESGQVIMRPEQRWEWSAVLLFPESGERLPPPFADWLKKDIESAAGDLKALVDGVPPEALRWSADGFQSSLNALISAKVPGWRCSARVQAAGRKAELEVKIYPQTPLLLAVSPETFSRTVPQLLAARINEKTLEYLSPLTGLPLDWISFHLNDVREWLSQKQVGYNWLKVLRASADNEISLKPVTKVTTRVESTTYTLRGWLSGHAGSDARLEAGMHFGHYFMLDEKIPTEVYSEVIAHLEDWDADARLGFRFSPLKSLWLGLEGSTEDAHLWYRLLLDAADGKTYGWFRYSEDNDWEAALGYRLNRFFSLELYYDDRQDDRVSVRALGNL